MELAPEEVSGRGAIYMYTVAVTAFHPFWKDKVPYTIAVVELAEQPGLGVTTNIVDCPEKLLRVGLPVEATFVETAPGLTLPMFRPAIRATGPRAASEVVDRSEDSARPAATAGR
ncbi:Zn-ribbon domain-containing OB-fold protein [Frankia nepalensis]|nr:OB-fold domain-containing protein [Frankia nepalensis]